VANECNLIHYRHDGILELKSIYVHDSSVIVNVTRFVGVWLNWSHMISIKPHMPCSGADFCFCFWVHVFPFNSLPFFSRPFLFPLSPPFLLELGPFPLICLLWDMGSAVRSAIYCSRDIWWHQFSANVNVSSRALYAIVRPSVVCRLSVTFVRPTQAIEILGIWYTDHPWPLDRNFTEIVLGEFFRREREGLNRRGVGKYSDFGHFQGYISETVQNRS